MKVFHLDTSINHANSASRVISAAIVEHLWQNNPGMEVVYRDLVADPVAHLDLAGLASLDAGHEVQQFLDSDVVVIGVAFYNFTISSQLKAWIDHIVVAGRTFKYTENGPVGLLTNTRIIIAVARGGIYGEGSPMSSLEHAETLLRGVFTGLAGAPPEFIIAEGLMMGADVRQAALDNALAQVRQLPAVSPRHVPAARL